MDAHFGDAAPWRLDAEQWQTIRVAGGDGKVYAFDSANGEARWAYDYGAPFNSQPVVAGSRVYIGSEDGNLLALDEKTGKLCGTIGPRARCEVQWLTATKWFISVPEMGMFMQ